MAKIQINTVAGKIIFFTFESEFTKFFPAVDKIGTNPIKQKSLKALIALKYLTIYTGTAVAAKPAATRMIYKIVQTIN